MRGQLLQIVTGGKSRASAGNDHGADCVALAEIDDGAPWHDQTLPLAERMKLAEGRPLRRRMMAAMAPRSSSMEG